MSLWDWIYTEFGLNHLVELFQGDFFKEFISLLKSLLGF